MLRGMRVTPGHTATFGARIARIARLGASACLAAGLCACSDDPAASLERGGQPNVLLIVADDLGYGDLGCYGNEEISTPRLDALAQQGVRLTDFYIASPMCSSSRASLLTGRYPERHGLRQALVEGDTTDGLDLHETLLPEVLRECGYRTALVGKWHLGMEWDYLPLRRGFDEFFGMLCASSGYYNHSYHGLADLWKGDMAIDREGEYSTDLYTGEALAFIERQAGEATPWFLMLSYNAPHVADDRTSLPAPALFRDLYEGVGQPEERLDFMAAVSAMDEGIGRVLDAIDSLPAGRETVVVFLSDNGPRAPYGSAGELSGGKDGLDEAGIRVPAIVRWPARIPAGSVCNEPLIAMDVMATLIVDACESEPRDLVLDGLDALPTLAGLSGSPHEALFWNHESRFKAFNGQPDYARVVRRGRWRLTYSGVTGTKLHDLLEDPGQTRNLADQEPGVVEELMELMETGGPRRQVGGWAGR